MSSWIFRESHRLDWQELRDKMVGGEREAERASWGGFNGREENELQCKQEKARDWGASDDEFIASIYSRTYMYLYMQKRLTATA